jgi:hypothetical protein
MTNTNLRPRGSAADNSDRRRSAPVSALVDEWVGAGIISDEQADQIKTRSDGEERSDLPSRDARRTSLAIEALSYLGGAIIVVGSLSLGAHYWEELTTLARLVIIGAVCVGLLASGFAVPDRLQEAALRLRSVLWLAATVATFGFLALVAADVLDLAGQDLLLLSSGGTALTAGALWMMRPGSVQQMAMMVALMIAAAAAIADFVSADSLPGLGVWAIAAVWVSLGWRQVLRPRRLAVTAGAASMVVGAMITSAEDSGVLLALATTAAIIVAAMASGDLLLLAVGALASLVVLPTAVSTWFPDAVAAPLALLVVGGCLVLAAIWTSRRRLQTR